MAEIQPYRYGQLPSAAVGTPGVDRAAGQAFATGAQGQYQLAQEQLQTQAQRGAITNQLVNTVATGLAGVMQMRKQQDRMQRNTDAALHVANYKALSDGEINDLQNGEESFDKPDNWNDWYSNRMNSVRQDFLNNIPDAKTRQMVARQIPGIEYSDRYRLDGMKNTTKTKLQEVKLNDLVSSTRLRAGDADSLEGVVRVNETLDDPALQQSMFRVWGGNWGEKVKNAKKDNLLSYFTTLAYKDPQRAESEMNMPALNGILTSEHKESIRKDIVARQASLTRDAKAAEDAREVAAKMSGQQILIDFDENIDNANLSSDANLALAENSKRQLTKLVDAEQKRGKDANFAVIEYYKSGMNHINSAMQKGDREGKFLQRQAIYDARYQAAEARRSAAAIAAAGNRQAAAANRLAGIEREKFEYAKEQQKNALANTARIANVDAMLDNAERLARQKTGSTGRLSSSKKAQINELTKQAQIEYNALRGLPSTLTRGEDIGYNSRIQALMGISDQSTSPQQQAEFVRDSEDLDFYKRTIDKTFPNARGIPGKTVKAFDVYREFASVTNSNISKWEQAKGQKMTAAQKQALRKAEYNRIIHKYAGEH